eukprot:jgi/Chrzof1/12774/Cz07g07040.t1
MLMRGHLEHDRRLQQLFSDPTLTTAVLWPGQGSLSPSELLAVAAQRSNGKIALVAVDATWSNANRMRKSYPANALQLQLPPDMVLQAGQTKSLFNPLRKYANAKASGRVCTLEAIAAALLALEGDGKLYAGLLHNLKLKVDAMLRQKSKPCEYDTEGYALPEASQARLEHQRQQQAAVAHRAMHRHKQERLDKQTKSAAAADISSQQQPAVTDACD